MEDVEVFYKHYGFQDILDQNILNLDLLKREALLAQRRDNLPKPAPQTGNSTTNSDLPTVHGARVVVFVHPMIYTGRNTKRNQSNEP